MGGEGKGRNGGLRFVERREWQMYAGGLSEADDLIDLLADNVVENTVVNIRTEIIRPRRRKEEKKKKKENVCDECSRRKMTVASGSSPTESRHDELKKIDVTSTEYGRERNEDVTSGKKEKLRKSGYSGSLQRRSGHEELTRADLVNVAHGRRRSKDTNVLSEKNDRLRKDGSGCTSYYSLSSSGEIESDEEIESVEEFENNKYAEERSEKYNMEFRNRNDKESYGLVEEIERHGEKQQGIRIEEVMASGLHEGSGVGWDRKKSEKQLIETVVDHSQSTADNTKKRFTTSEAYNSSYIKSDNSQKQFQSSGVSSSLISNRREGRNHSDATNSTEISRSRRRHHDESKFEDIHESDAVTNSNQLVQPKLRQEDASTSTNFIHAIKERREQDVVRRSSQQHTGRGTIKIQEIDDTDKVSNLRHAKQSTYVESSVQDLKEDRHRHISTTVTEAELRRTSQQVTNIAATNHSEIQKTSSSDQQSNFRIKIGEESSRLVTGMSQEETGKTRQAVREDHQRVQSRKGASASLESFVQNSGLSTTIDSQSTSHQVGHTSEEKRHGRSQLDESYKQIEVRRERERLAQESSFLEEASENAIHLSLETRLEQVNIKARDKRTTQSIEMLAANQPETGGSLSEVPTTSYVYDRASQDDMENRYNSQRLQQQGQYHSSEFESYGGDTRDDTYAQPLSVLSSEDALRSAERMENSSNILIEEFVEQAQSELPASEVQEEKLRKTKSENKDSKKQGFAGAELKSPSHSSEGKGPSDEKWDMAQSSVELPPKTVTPEVSPKAGNTSVKRTGRSLWNVIGDVVRARWIFRGESQNSPSKLRKRSSSNESASSDTWFSGHEHDENITKEAEKRSPFHESASSSNQLKPEKEHTESQLAGSDAIAVFHEHGLSGSSLTTGFSGSSSAGTGVSLTYEEAKPPSSGPERSILATFSSAGMLGTSASMPASFPSRRLSRSPAVGSTSRRASARDDPTASGSAEVIDQQPSPLRLTEASEPEEKEGELTRRKFQRTKQVPRDKFEEWEEAFMLETEQHKIDDIFMREALVEAQKAADNWEVPVGAVLVQHGKIIARGCNLVEELRDSTAHAEMICIRDASNALRTWRLSETTLYVTLEPCAMCAGAILQARVTTLVWGAPNKLLGADGSWIRLFPEDGERDNSLDLADKPPAPVHPFHPKMNIRRGVLGAECGQVMQQFFHLRRQKKNKSEPSSPPPPSCLPVSTNPVKLITKILPIYLAPSSSSPRVAVHPPPKKGDEMFIIGSDDNLSNGGTNSRFDDDRKVAFEPLIARAFSTGSGDESSQQQQQRRRRSGSDLESGQQATVGEEVEHVAEETYLVTRLGVKLIGYLGVGYRWITRLLALQCYSLLLMPGFIQVGYYYYFSKQVRRSIIYGDQPRNRLDLYMPKDSDGPKPVIAFVTGGAWIIGYKAWGSLLGQQLSERGIIVACIDYRNFPQATIGEMVKDAAQGISFLCNNISDYGGDPNKIYLMGQSAGAHIGACALWEQAIKESKRETISWSVSQIQAYFGLSGGYNLFNLVDHFDNRGLYRSIFLSIMEGEQSLRRYSPQVMVQDPTLRDAVSLLPPIILFHGTGDYSIPCEASKSFADTLQSLGVQAETILYEGKTHTDVFVQDPMRGGRDELFEDLVSYIHRDDPEALAADAVAPPRRRLVPEFMLKLAHIVSPF
ncbi:unnamed protein product [Rhodiola kirilowii]